MNIIPAMAYEVNYFYYCLSLTQHKYYFWNSAAFAFSGIDLTVKQNIYHLHAYFFLRFQLPQRLMSCHCVKPAKSRCYMLSNTLVPGKCSNYFKIVIFLFMSQIEFLSTFCEIALRCMPHNPIDGSTLVQVIAWCCQATNHYPSQCWPRSMSPYGVIMPQWVDICLYMSNTFFAVVHLWHSHSCLIFLECHQLIPHTHELALFHQILPKRELSSFPSLLCLSIYVFVLVWL